MRQRLAGLLCNVSAFVVLASCGGDSGGPNNPTPTVTSITVTSTSGFLVLGITETFTATVAFSNGTSQALTGGTWGTDAASVATVNATSGLVTTVARGDVTIFVDSQGVRGSKRVTVLPNYAGLWNGRYVVGTCTETGGFVGSGLCGSTFAVGANLPVTLSFTQTGASIGGFTVLGTVASSNFTTTAVAGGGLVFQANAQLQAPPFTFRVDEAWQVNAAVAGQLTGSVVLTWTEPTVTGQAVVGATLQSTVKSSAQPMSVRPNGTFGSLADIGAAIRGR